MKFFYALLFSICLILSSLFSAGQQVIINEVSQGQSGGKEYVELLIVGIPGCTDPLPCIDLRGYYIDDNNGFYATGSGVGIAQGCVRLSQDALWSCVPIGTLILIYNDADMNSLVPSTDLSLADGNCTLVIPISDCNLFEKNIATPSTSVSAFPTTGFSSCGNWTNISMANGDDSYQILSPMDLSAAEFAVSWSNNTANTIIYFSGGMTATVAYMANLVDNDPFNQANWTTGGAPAAETPGAPNNAANATWINSMNNSCQPIIPVTASITATNISCNGGNNGAANLTPSGGATAYTFLWSDGTTTEDLSGIGSGIYTVTITDANGCSITDTAVINEPAPVNTNAPIINVSCNGGNNGSATVLVSGGTSPYSYSWSSGGTSDTETGLSAGSYQVTVTDANGCSIADTASIGEPSAISTNIASTDVTCYSVNNGEATVTVSGGTSPYFYLWSSGGTSATETGLAAGTHTVTVTDNNGCVYTSSVLITEPQAITTTTSATPATCGVSNGSATVTATGGAGAYTYSWAPVGGTDSTATGLSAGIYTVTVTDAGGCSQTASVTISNPGGATVSINSFADVSCSGGNDGSATVTATGGTSPFAYSWSGGSTDSTASGLMAGSYDVTVTDADGCIANISVSIAQPLQISTTISPVNVSCNGGSNGSATVTASGGTSPFAYLWPSGGNSAMETGLAAGSYPVTITDANGCSITDTATIGEPSAISTSVTTTDVSCNGGSNGDAAITASGGISPYIYSWSSGGTASAETGLSAGSYTVTVTDNNGCLASSSISITEPPALTATTSTTQTACGNSNGSATVNASGGISPYTYLWSQGSNDATATGLLSGIYTVTVTDSISCAQTTTATITDAGAPAVTISSLSAVTCFGANDGSVNASATGGFSPYSFTWSSGSTDSTATGLGPGTYTVSVTDASGCIAAASASVTEPSALTISSSQSEVNCFGGNNGSITIAASGGISPYIYSWSSGSTSITASGLTAGNYSVTVIDNNGCSIVNPYIITQPTALSTTGTQTDVSCNGGNNGSASVTASGGISPYTYSWPSGGTIASETGLSAGTYIVTITDSTGCTATAALAVSEPAVLTITTSADTSSCNQPDGTATAFVSGGTSPYTYVWDDPFAQTTASAGNLTAGQYCVTFTDLNGCSGQACVTVPDAPGVTLSVSASANTLCNGSCDGFATVDAAGGTSPYNFTWSSGENTATATGLCAGSYTVTVIDASGCVDTAVAPVSEPLPVIVTPDNPVAICIGQSATLSASAAGGTPSYSFLWSPQGPVVSPSSTQSYTVTATDANGCLSAPAIITVTVNPPLSVAAAGETICKGDSAVLTASGSGGDGNITYSWLPGNLGGASVTVSPIGTTIYSVIVSDGCFTPPDTAIVTITVAPLPAVIFNADTQVGCAPLCVTFTNWTPNTDVVAWTFGDSATGINSVESHCYNTPGTYSVTLNVTDLNGCSNNSVHQNMIVVYPVPEADFSASPQTATIINPTIHFSNTSTGGSQWEWNFGDVLQSSSDEQHSVFAYTDTGCFEVQLIVLNQSGCSDTTRETVCIEDDFAIYVPNAFTPDGSGSNNFFFPKGVGIDWEHFEMFIFDRWGDLIYRTTDINKPWDGKANYGAEIAQIDVYVWKINVLDYAGNEHKLMGHVTLVK